MSSINRPLAGPMLTFDLQQQHAELQREEAYQRSGRASRTLVKSGRLRVVMTAIKQGAAVGTHQADSPLTVHVLRGHIRYRTHQGTHELAAGQLLYFGAGDAHDITADEESLLLLSISARGDDFMMEEPTEAQAPGRGDQP